MPITSTFTISPLLSLALSMRRYIVEVYYFLAGDISKLVKATSNSDRASASDLKTTGITPEHILETSTEIRSGLVSLILYCHYSMIYLYTY